MKKVVDITLIMWYYNYRDKERGATYDEKI